MSHHEAYRAPIRPITERNSPGIINSPDDIGKVTKKAGVKSARRDRHDDGGTTVTCHYGIIRPSAIGLITAVAHTVVKSARSIEQ